MPNVVADDGCGEGAAVVAENSLDGMGGIQDRQIGRVDMVGYAGDGAADVAGMAVFQNMSVVGAAVDDEIEGERSPGHWALDCDPLLVVGSVSTSGLGFARREGVWVEELGSVSLWHEKISGRQEQKSKYAGPNFVGMEECRR